MSSTLRGLLAIAAVLLATLPGCECGQCSPASSQPDGGCLDQWSCSAPLASGTYQVRCTGWDSDAGWLDCGCWRDGRLERPLGNGGVWCRRGSPDGFERIIDANRACGWSMPTTGI